MVLDLHSGIEFLGIERALCHPLSRLTFEYKDEKAKRIKK